MRATAAADTAATAAGTTTAAATACMAAAATCMAAAATCMAAAAAAFRCVSRSRQRGRKNNDSNTEFESQHNLFRSVLFGPFTSLQMRPVRMFHGMIRADTSKLLTLIVLRLSKIAHAGPAVTPGSHNMNCVSKIRSFKPQAPADTVGLFWGCLVGRLSGIANFQARCLCLVLDQRWHWIDPEECPLLS
jgi:hypothetical protein